MPRELHARLHKDLSQTLGISRTERGNSRIAQQIRLSCQKHQTTLLLTTARAARGVPQIPPDVPNEPFFTTVEPATYVQGCLPRVLQTHKVCTSLRERSG